MTIIILFALFATAQVADFASYHPSTELNPIVLTLGSFSVLLKIALVVYIACVTVALLAAQKYLRIVPPLLIIGIAAGFLGTATNLMSR